MLFYSYDHHSTRNLSVYSPASMSYMYKHTIAMHLSDCAFDQTISIIIQSFSEYATAVCRRYYCIILFDTI